MKQTSFNMAVFGICTLLILGGTRALDALSLDGANLKAGVHLTREQAVNYYGVGGQFDSHQWMFGGSIDMGSLFLPKLHFVPGGDLLVQNNLKIIVANLDFLYFFHQSPKGRGYAGAGWGTHFIRHSDPALENDIKVGLNVPLGFQRKLGSGMGWFGEMKLIIADDERDSALQFSVGLSFGPLD